MTRRALFLITAGAVFAVPVAALSVESDAGSDISSSAAPVSHSLLARLGLPGSLAWREGATRPVAGNFVVSRGPAFGPKASPLHLYAGIESLDPIRASQLLAPNRREAVTVAYAWHGLTVEGSAAGANQAQIWAPPEETGWQLVSRRARLSYSPLPGLAFQFTRGTWNTVDQLMANGEIRRTSLSASYTRRITGGEWQTTFAWGRNAPKDRPSLTGYLAETSVRFAGAHLAFGRFEQVGRDDLGDLPISSSQLTKLNKMSVGYYQDLHRSRAARVGVGIMASRYLVPAAHAAALRSDITSYMLFMRVNLQ